MTFFLTVIFDEQRRIGMLYRCLSSGDEQRQKLNIGRGANAKNKMKTAEKYEGTALGGGLVKRPWRAGAFAGDSGELAV